MNLKLDLKIIKKTSKENKGKLDKINKHIYEIDNYITGLSNYFKEVKT
jgi:hypothetical protein